MFEIAVSRTSHFKDFIFLIVASSFGFKYYEDRTMGPVPRTYGSIGVRFYIMLTVLMRLIQLCSNQKHVGSETKSQGNESR